MFLGLFGKKKPVPVSTTTIIDTSIALLEREEDLEERNEILETKSKNAVRDSLAANRAGKKQQALIYLNKHKLYEKEIANNNAMILKLIMQRSTVETINVHTDTLNVMRMANEVVKRQQSELNTNKGANLEEIMKDLMGNMADVTELTAPMASCMVGLADLDAELAALERGSAPAEKTVIEEANPSSPTTT